MKFHQPFSLAKQLSVALLLKQVDSIQFEKFDQVLMTIQLLKLDEDFPLVNFQLLFKMLEVQNAPLTSLLFEGFVEESDFKITQDVDKCHLY